MFTRVEVRNFRSLRDVSVPLSNFHVLVGANGSGKTTFLDVFAFMGDLLNKGIYEAVQLRVNNFNELTFGGLGSEIEFAFEAMIPNGISMNPKLRAFDAVRYELKIWAENGSSKTNTIENCFLFKSTDRPKKEHWQNSNYVAVLVLGSTDISFDSTKVFQAVQILTDKTGTTLVRETSELFREYPHFESDKLVLGALSEDIQKYPVTTWLKNQFKKFIQPIQIESGAISKAGKERRPGTVNPDGSNLPWLIDSLKKKYPDRYKLWFRHIQSDFPEIKSIKTVLREDQNDMFLKIKYKEGHEVKQWMVSDGTLRYLLLTIIPYLLDLEGLFLIEEPEIGLHPRAIQSVMDSLRSVYGGQVLVTTHSPETVNCATKKELLIFSKNEAGETQIMPATEHPYFKDWKLDLGSGVFYGPGVMK